MTNFALIATHYSPWGEHPVRNDRRVYIRDWVPGDGVRCQAGRRGSDIPCSKPVAVEMTETYEVKTNYYGSQGVWLSKRRVVCLRHLPEVQALHAINGGAKKAAAERLIAEHWDDYQSYLAESREAQLAEALSNAPEEVQRIARAALDRDDFEDAQ